MHSNSIDDKHQKFMLVYIIVVIVECVDQSSLAPQPASSISKLALPIKPPVLDQLGSSV